MQPENKGHRIIAIIVISFLMAGLSGGGVYYLLNQQNKAQEVLINELQKEIPKAEKVKEEVREEAKTEEAKDETADLNTYNNSSHGLSFKHPSSYTINDTTLDDVGSDDSVPWYSRSDFVKQVLQLNGNNVKAKVVLSSSDIDMTIGGFGGSGKTQKEFSVNGLKAYYITNYGQGPSSQNIVYILAGPKYSLLVWGVDGSKNDEINSLIQTATIN